MLQRMNDNAYNANLGLDDYFFFQIPTKLGEGTKKSPARIMMTSKWCMENCKYLDRGVFQMDGTYRLTKTNYPWVVCGVTDLHGCFHPIAFMITNAETEDDFVAFLKGIKQLSKQMTDEQIFDLQEAVLGNSEV